MSSPADKTADDELIETIRVGFWRLRAESAPNLIALAHRTFGDEHTTTALRRRLRRGLMTLSPAYSDSAFTLFGVTDEAAGLKLGERQELAGETEHLPGGRQAKSTVRGPGGLQEFLVTRLLSYFEDGPVFPEIDPTQGRGYSNLSYNAHCTIAPSSPLRWEIDLRFTVSAYRADVEIVTTALHARRAAIESVDVLSQAHHKIGAVPIAPALDNSALMLAIYLETPLARGVPTSFHIREVGTHDGKDAENQLGINIARYPTAVTLEVDTPCLLAPSYTRLHQIKQAAHTRTLSEQDVDRSDDSPMEYAIGVTQPHTRYALRWRNA